MRIVRSRAILDGGAAQRGLAIGKRNARWFTVGHGAQHLEMPATSPAIDVCAGTKARRGQCECVGCNRSGRVHEKQILNEHYK